MLYIYHPIISTLVIKVGVRLLLQDRKLEWPRKIVLCISRAVFTILRSLGSYHGKNNVVLFSDF